MPPAAPSHLCVFCGASHGSDPDFAHAAAALGASIAQRGITLVYGGGSVGLMGVTADAALAAGGSVLGVITEQLHDRELGHKGIQRLVVTKSMHARKMAMADHAQGFIVLPGGFGTLDEMFEIIAWAQLGLHHKPIGLLNTNNFYDRLLDFLDHAAAKGFLRISHRTHLFHDADPEAALLDRMLRRP